MTTDDFSLGMFIALIVVELGLIGGQLKQIIETLQKSQ